MSEFFLAKRGWLAPISQDNFAIPNAKLSSVRLGKFLRRFQTHSPVHGSLGTYHTHWKLRSTRGNGTYRYPYLTNRGTRCTVHVRRFCRLCLWHNTLGGEMEKQHSLLLRSTAVRAPVNLALIYFWVTGK